MKKMIVVIFFMTVSNIGVGQDSISKQIRIYKDNNIYVEFLGNSILYGSINYERVFYHYRCAYIMGRIGTGYGLLLGESWLSAPILVNAIFTFRDFAFEIGGGVTLVRFGEQQQEDSKNWTYVFMPNIAGCAGIRLTSKGGFLFRATFTPFYNITITQFNTPSNRFGAWLGISFGCNFGNKKREIQQNNHY